MSHANNAERRAALIARGAAARQLLTEGLSRRQIAAQLDCDESSVRRALNAVADLHDTPEPGVVVVSDEPQTVPPQTADHELLLRERGYDPAQCQVLSVKLNEWEGVGAEGEKVKLYQRTATIRPRPQTLQFVPPLDGKPVVIKPPAKNKATLSRRGTLWAFVADEQEPFSDPRAKALVCQWLRHNQPDELVHLGDGIDADEVSRYLRDWPQFMRKLSTSCDDFARTLLSYRASVPASTRCRYLIGNHEWRLQGYVAKNAPALLGLRRALCPDEDPVLSWPFLLRLDDLGWEYVPGANGNPDYPYARIVVTPELVAKHGNKVSLTAEVKGKNYGVIQGHLHREESYSETKYNAEGVPVSVIESAVTGCLCRIDLGYAPEPNWQQSILTVWLPEGGGRPVIERARIADGVLTWRDQRWEVDA